MDPRLIDCLITLFLPVALILVALHIGAQMTGFGKKLVSRLTGMIVRGSVALLIIVIVLTLLTQRLSR